MVPKVFKPLKLYCFRTNLILLPAYICTELCKYDYAVLIRDSFHFLNTNMVSVKVITDKLLQDSTYSPTAWTEPALSTKHIANGPELFPSHYGAKFFHYHQVTCIFLKMTDKLQVGNV